VAVLAAVFEARPVFDTEPAPIALSAVQEPSDLPVLLDEIRAATGEDGAAIAVMPTWGPRRLRETLDGARMLLGPRRLLIAETSLPPLAASVVTSTLAGVLQRVGDPQVAVRLLPHLEERIVSLAWLSSVTGLEHLEIPLRMHLRSYVSRSGFVARTQPDPAVLRVGDDEHPLTIDLPRRPRVIVADREGDPDWCNQRLLPLLDGAPLAMVEPSEHGPQWWGARKLIEVVVTYGDLDALTQAVRRKVTFHTCSWCGASTAGSCVRCGAADDQIETKETAE
jgi:hypothetical protein